VGLLEGTGGVSWSVLGKTAVGWVMTLVIVGLMSASLMALGVYSPNIRAAKVLTKLRNAAETEGIATVDFLKTLCRNNTQAEEEILVRFVLANAHHLEPAFALAARAPCMEPG
jgi:hypothetical protein